MTQQGKDLLQAIKSMRNFFGDVSHLLRTAEALMGERSWEVNTNSGCLYAMSYSVNTGHLWMPREAVRTFKNDSYPRTIAMIAVLFDDYKIEEYKLEEPVVSGSYFVFPEKMGPGKIKLDFEQSRQFGWNETSTDGIPVEMDDSDKDWYKEYGWKYMQVFGRPLVEISNEETLKAKIIDPLIELIGRSPEERGK
jgi:hypothetical protein